MASEEDLDMNQILKRISDYITELLPNAILISEQNGNFVYQIPLNGFNGEKLFVDMQKSKARLRITDWGIS